MLSPSRILITGFSGFVGSYLVERCRVIYPEAELFGLSRRFIPATTAHAARNLTPLLGDIAQPASVRRAIAETRPDMIFHLAAQPSVAASWNDPGQSLRVNAGGVLNLFEALRAERIFPRVVLVGSGEQYGMVRPEENPLNEECSFRPVNPYAVSKVAQDLYGYQYFVAYGLPIMRVRPFNHFGPGQAETFVVASFSRQIALIEAGKAESILLVGNLKAQRDFLPVEDVVSAYLVVAEHGQSGEAYNVGSGEARSIEEVLNLLLSLTNVPIKVREDPDRLRPIDIPLIVADASRLRAHTGWKPSVDFERAVRRTLDYWRKIVSSPS